MASADDHQIYPPHFANAINTSKKQLNFNLVYYRACVECWTTFPPYTLVLIVAVSVQCELYLWQ